MLLYVVCFDISNDSKRRRVSRRLEHFGQRVQYSVFEVVFKSQRSLQSLRKELREHLDEEDSLHFYPLCKSCRSKALNAREGKIAHVAAAVVV